jgi:hypothetical protein
MNVLGIFIVGLVLLAAAAMTGRASAATMEQAMAQFREQLTPAVRACVHEKIANNGGSADQYIPACKTQVTAPFKACIAKLIGATGGSAVVLPKPACESACFGYCLRRSTGGSNQNSCTSGCVPRCHMDRAGMQ